MIYLIGSCWYSQTIFHRVIIIIFLLLEKDIDCDPTGIEPGSSELQSDSLTNSFTEVLALEHMNDGIYYLSTV